MTHAGETAPTWGDHVRTTIRGLGQLLITLGVVILLFVVYELYGTNFYTKDQQHKLEHDIALDWLHGGVEVSQAQIGHVPLGSGIAVLRIPRFGRGYHLVIVEGTGYEDLKKGPGHYPETALPGQVGNFSVAGHRTTYLAPFSHIDAIRDGDVIRLQMPYAMFVYRAFMHRVVTASDMSVLRSPNHELLELQACHPRFFATHRYIVYARLVSVLPRGGVPYPVESASAAG